MYAASCCAKPCDRGGEVRVGCVSTQPGFNRDAEDTEQDKAPIIKPVEPEKLVVPLQEEPPLVFEEPVLTTLRQYRITLSKNVPSDRVSIDVDYGNGKTLIVRRVKDGLLQEFNEKNPDMKVVPGDVFMVINGKFGDAKVLLEELLNAPTLDILVKKNAAKK